MIRDHAGQVQIYADYQASTPVDKRVAENLGRYFAQQTANPHSDDHAFGWEAAEQLEDARRRLAAVINCDADELIFTSGATEANNIFIQGLASRQSHRRRIIVSAIEHKSVLEAARAATRHECRVEVLAVDDQGRVRVEDLIGRLREDVLLVSVMAVNNEIGSVQPIAEIGSLCESVGSWFHTDAVQALGNGPVDVAAMNVHALSLSAHKIYGPQGIGALYVRRDVQPHLQAMTVGGGQQNGLRSGTVPVALSRALADAAELMHGAVADAERDRVRKLRDRFVERMLSIDGIRLNGPPLHERHPGNANLCFLGLSAADILERLQPHLAASTGSACTSGTREASHVLMALGLSADDVEASIRFSFGRHSSANDVDRAVELIREALARRTRRVG